MTKKEKIKIVIVDDAQIYRDGVESLLAKEDSFQIVDCVESGEKLFKLLKITTPDVILLDIEMPVMKGDKVLEILKQNYPFLKVIMVSFYFEEALLEYYENKGAFGFIPKDADGSVYINTITEAARGNKTFNHMIIVRLLLKRKTNSKKFNDSIDLTKREIEIISLICTGKVNRDIASILFLTERAVEFHKTNIYKKIGCSGTANLILFAIEKGIFTKQT